MMWMLLIPLTVGLASALAVWGLRDWFYRRFNTDVAWIQSTWLRFNPDPPNARVVVSGIYAVLLVCLLGLLVLIGNPLVAGGLWLFLLIVPKILVEMAWSQRRQKIDKQLPAAIATMSNSIRAGLSLVQAVERLSEQAPEPIRTEFKVMANRYAFGANVETTVREAKERLMLPNFNLFASALLLNREMGGDVAETLDRISRSLERLQQMRQTVEAHTAEGRTNIKVLLVSPLFMLLIIASVDQEGVELMFTTASGYGVLLVAGLLAGVGAYFAAKITRSEV